MGIKILVKENKTLTVLRALERSGKDFTPILREIGTLIESSVQQRFDTKTDPDGKAWAAWSAKTAEARAKENRGALLVYTGNMRSGLSSSVANKQVRVGFNVDYAQNHEFGTSKIPGRRMLLTRSNDLSTADRAEIYELLLKHFTKQ